MKTINLSLTLILAAALLSCKNQQIEPQSQLRADHPAKQLYEQQRNQLPSSKSTDKSDLVKPMPGNFEPKWELANEQQMADGATAVTTPIATTDHYTAKFPCTESHSHEGHSHNVATPVIQKMAAITGGDNPRCYIVNIVPFAECTLSAQEITTGFKFETGMNGITGFAAYHNFDGSLAYIDCFENGAKVDRCAPSDNTKVGTNTRFAQLFIDEGAWRGISKAYDDGSTCDLCFRWCGREYDIGVNSRDNLENYYAHCEKCRKLKPDYCTCSNPEKPVDPFDPGNPKYCPICYKLNCQTNHFPSGTCVFCNGGCGRYVGYVSPNMVHRVFIHNKYSTKIDNNSLHNLQASCYYVDTDLNRPGDEYRHNFKLPTESYEVALSKLRNSFITNMKSFALTRDYNRFGEALHPILDYYIPNHERMAMLNYFTYSSYSDIIPYETIRNKDNDITNLSNAIMALPQYASDAEVGAIFDRFLPKGF